MNKEDEEVKNIELINFENGESYFEFETIPKYIPWDSNSSNFFSYDYDF